MMNYDLSKVEIWKPLFANSVTSVVNLWKNNVSIMGNPKEYNR